MNRLSAVLIAAVATIALTQMASADDRPRKVPAYTPPPPVYDWTGFYVGANIGGGWGSTALSNPPFIGAPPSASHDSSEVLGGLQLGHNWQLNRNSVIGIETDFNRTTR
jgi:outer membrane immunogenic protein